MARLNGKAPHREDDIQQLKAGADLVEVVRGSGIELRQRGRNLVGRCPFHEDDDPSLVVNPERQLWNCFGCKAGGDVLNFLQLREKLEFPEALERLRVLARAVEPVPSSAETDPSPDRLAGGLGRFELLERVTQIYQQGLKNSPHAQEYLVGRGLGSRELWDAFRIGYADGALLKALDVQGGPAAEALTQLGVLAANGRELMAGCLVVPLTHPDQGIVDLYARRLDPAAKVRHLYLPGPKRGIFNWQALKASRDVYLAEGVLDAMSAWVAGCRNVTCLFGVHGLPVDLTQGLSRFQTREVRLCLDADPAGRQASERIGRQLSERGIRVQALELPDGQDLNQLLVQGGPEELRTRLRVSASAGDQAEPVFCAGEREELSDGFILRFDAIAYEVRPIPPFSHQRKVRLRASWGEQSFLDKPDLDSHRTRNLAIVQLSTRTRIPKDELERHFLRLSEETERWVEMMTSGEGSLSERRPAFELGQDEREEALEFLRRPDLAQAILEDMEQLGYVGEEKGKLLGYLIGISRKLDKPLSGVVISQSGAGKSGLAELILALTPPEDAVPFTRVTAQALYYLPRDFLKHKLLSLEERKGAEDADYSIRALQSARRLSLMAPVKDPNTGKHQTISFEVEGPVAYLETTTQNRIDHENDTRCFEINLDQSEDQTRRIHQRQRLARSPGRLELDAAAEGIKKRHQNAQRLLEPASVVIPYVMLLSFPVLWLRTRRDHERFLCLIETVAFLHQRQRERGTHANGVSFVVATPADYRLAYELARDVLASTFHELSRDARDLLQKAQEMLDQAGATEDLFFTRKDLRGHTQWHDHRLRSALNELVEMEYVLAVNGSQGKTYHYRLAARLDANQTATPMRDLTTPDQLDALWRDAQLGQPG
ncbi:toprim domain-containing protein [bacterium CPR1]|nr:toprim domain-containing protein [bacterium CPR1]